MPEGFFFTRCQNRDETEQTKREALFPGCQRLFFFASEASEQRGEAASMRREARLPSEPAKRLIFTTAICQRASGTRVEALLIPALVFRQLGVAEVGMYCTSFLSLDQ